MSVFESFRVANSKPQHLAAHLARLRAGCAARQLPCDEKALEATADPLREAAVDGFARVYVTAGDGTATAQATETRIFLFVEAREWSPVESCDIELAVEIHHPIFDGLKTGNYWSNLDRLGRAKAHGKDEALLFNDRGELISACCANVFLVQNGVVRTPSCRAGARAGVIRERVMQEIHVEETNLSRDDALRADEIFLTNSWAGIVPVTSVDGRGTASQAIARMLRTPASSCHE